MRVRFGECVFDSASRELTRAGRRIELTPKAFALLHALLARRPNVVGRSELHDLLWPETFVASTSLPRLVNEIRKAIGDAKGDSQRVRTVYGFGYSFSGAADDEASGEAPLSSAFQVVWGDRAIPLPVGENLIGRASECRISIASSRVSRHHAKIVVTEDGAVIEDLGSKNGTFVRGARIAPKVRLTAGDEIVIGPAVLIFRAPGGGGTTVSGAVVNRRFDPA